MKQIRTFLLLFATLIAFSFATAPLAGGYKVGDKAIDFKLKNVDGKKYSLAGIKDAKGYIVVFTCNHCPFSKAYEDRIIQLHQQYAPQGYPVVAINPNDAKVQPDDSFDKMVLRAQEKSFPFLYLYDQTQEIARTYGATRTPHVFLLDKKRIVRYIGAIDDNAETPSEVKEKYLENAIEALKAGQEIKQPLTKAIGCTIKWKKD